MKTLSIFSLAIALLFCGCASEDVTSNASTLDTTTPQGGTVHSSQSSIDWAGTYMGTVPCADCEGIETILILGTNQSYTRKTKMLGKDNKQQEETGSFIWDKEGQIIMLSGVENGANKFFVGENMLYQLDAKGERVSGALAEKYILRKSTGNTDLKGTYWKLVMLDDKELPEGKWKESFVRFKADGDMEGSGACNTIRGTYGLQETNRIRITGVTTTKMACTGIETESQFFKALDKADSYEINGNVLFLNRPGRTNPLAKFEAVPGK